MIRTDIHKWDTYLSQTGNRISKFNTHSKTLNNTITERGETIHDLLTKLFKTYSAWSDNNFVKYVIDNRSELKYGKYMNTNWQMINASNK